MTTHNALVLRLLRSAGPRGLTPLEALDEIGCMRLGARIWDVKMLLSFDEEIVTERAHSGGKSYARYVLRARVPSQAGYVAPTLWGAE